MTERKDGPGEQPPPAEQGPVQRYRFRVRTADGRELVSHIATVKLPPPPAQPRLMEATPIAMVVAPLLQVQPVTAAKNYVFTRMLVNVEGGKQGKFHADSAAKSLESHQFAAVQLDFAIPASIDAASGQRSGKLAHEPVVLTKELGPSTPQFRNALVNNESLTSVVFDFYGTQAHGGGGKEELGFTIKLTNANVASAELQKLNVKHPDLMKIPDCERIAFTYEKIEWSWKDGASASEQWSAPS
jgi:type VI secretion system secreted protein Hcp